jgi:hypothetical protein
MSRMALGGVDVLRGEKNNLPLNRALMTELCRASLSLS